MIRDKQAYMRGASAKYKGKLPDDNPYCQKHQSDEHQAWLRGYEQTFAIHIDEEGWRDVRINLPPEGTGKCIVWVVEENTTSILKGWVDMATLNERKIWEYYPLCPVSSRGHKITHWQYQPNPPVIDEPSEVSRPSADSALADSDGKGSSRD